MISDTNRAYYIGASDTSYVVGNWETKSFEKWYLEKLGLRSNDFTNTSMLAGTNYEHRILDSLQIPALDMDSQKIIGRLRVNLDGNTPDVIYEVKTYKYENGFKLSKKYKEQVYVQMYAFDIRKAYIVSYGLTESDYNNFFHEVVDERLQMHEIEYDETFINQKYLPCLGYISKCLDEGRFPRRGDFEVYRNTHTVFC